MNSTKLATAAKMDVAISNIRLEVGDKELGDIEGRRLVSQETSVLIHVSMLSSLVPLVVEGQGIGTLWKSDKETQRRMSMPGRGRNPKQRRKRGRKMQSWS